MPTSLNSKQVRYLRSLAHHRRAVVTLGSQGLTPPVLAEIEQALAHHELLKIRINSGDREARHSILEEICEATGAAAVQEIGRMVVIYRGAKTPRINLPV